MAKPVNLQPDPPSCVLSNPLSGLRKTVANTTHVFIFACITDIRNLLSLMMKIGMTIRKIKNLRLYD